MAIYRYIGNQSVYDTTSSFSFKSSTDGNTYNVKLNDSVELNAADLLSLNKYFRFLNVADIPVAPNPQGTISPLDLNFDVSTQAEADQTTNSLIASTFLPAGLFPGGADTHGDSISAGYGANSWPYGGWGAKLAAMLGTTFALHAVTGAIGNRSAAWSQVLQEDSVSVKSDAGFPWRSWPGGDRLRSIGFLFNDLNMDGGQAAIPSLISAMRTMVSRSLAYLIREDDYLSLVGASGSGTGGWAQVNATNRNSGSGYWETAANGDTFTYLSTEILPGMAYAVGGPVAKGTVGFIDIRVNGVLKGTVDLAAVAARATGEYGSWSFRVTDLVPYSALYSQNIVGTVRGLTGGSKATVDYAHVEAPIPTPVIVRGMCCPTTTNPYWAASTQARDADIIAGNLALKNLCAEFVRPNGVSPVLYLDVQAAINGDQACFSNSVTDTGAALNDNLHLNNLGYRKVAVAARALLVKYYRSQASSPPASAL